MSAGNVTPIHGWRESHVSVIHANDPHFGGTKGAA